MHGKDTDCFGVGIGLVKVYFCVEVLLELWLVCVLVQVDVFHAGQAVIGIPGECILVVVEWRVLFSSAFKHPEFIVSDDDILFGVFPAITLKVARINLAVTDGFANGVPLSRYDGPLNLDQVGLKVEEVDSQSEEIWRAVGEQALDFGANNALGTDQVVDRLFGFGGD